MHYIMKLCPANIITCLGNIYIFLKIAFFFAIFKMSQIFDHDRYINRFQPEPTQTIQ